MADQAQVLPEPGDRLWLMGSATHGSWPGRGILVGHFRLVGRNPCDRPALVVGHGDHGFALSRPLSCFGTDIRGEVLATAIPFDWPGVERPVGALRPVEGSPPSTPPEIMHVAEVGRLADRWVGR